MKKSLEVLARKYRPTNFEELIGQETISQTLSLALDSNRLSHAYLFSGLRGSGKTSTARIFAKALICEKGISKKPCAVCENCVMALEGRHIDIIEMDAASNRGIDDIRELIEQTKYKPAASRFKIFIIDEVHMLTPQAFNALLKTLEEPPSFVKFILATTDPLKLPATILSRTQHFRFKSIAKNKIINHLTHILNIEEVTYENEALEIIARSGAGSLRDTLTLLDQAIIYSKNHVDLQTVTDMLGLVDPSFITDLFNAIFAKDHVKLHQHLEFLQEYEADMVINELIAYLKERMYASDAMFSTLVLDRFFRILSDSKYLLSINADGSFVLSLIFFKMIEALKIKEVDEMIESLQKEIRRPAISCSSDNVQNIMQEEEKNDETYLHVERNINTDTFENLISKIKDRSFQLGECFEKSIKFISFENKILAWESCTDEECKKILTHGYAVIKQLVRETFGFETTIKHHPCTNPPQVPDKEEKYEQATSMIEDAETSVGSSCINNYEDASTATKEINGAEILNEEMVKKAVEFFEAKKVTIQSKT